MTEQNGRVIYQETQRWSLAFRCLLVALCLFSVLASIYAIAVILHRDSIQWSPLLMTVLCGVFIPLTIGLLIWIFRLRTEVRSDGLYIRCIPFHSRPRRFEPRDLAESYVRRYRPILEYGGWGIRYGLKGRAYNVSGNHGVQLVLNDGKRILIGSSRPAELEAAIHTITNTN